MRRLAPRCWEASLGGKWLQLLWEIAPGLKRAAFMFNLDTAPASTVMPSLETAARSLKVEPMIAPVHGDVEIETAITALGREPGGGLVVVPDAFLATHRAPIILAAARNHVPAVYWQSVFARDGGLLSYGVNQVDLFRRAASYVDRILRGAKPGDLPVLRMAPQKLPENVPVDQRHKRADQFVGRYANIISADSVFRIADAGNSINAPFFDIEDEYFVKADLWLIASVAITLMDLFYGVNQGRNVLDFRGDFVDSIRKMAEESNALLAELKATDRFKRAIEKFGLPGAT